MSEPLLNIASRMLDPDRQRTTLETRIANYLRIRSGVTLIELSRDVPGFTGDKTWVFREHNIVVWPGLSEAAIQAMLSLITTGKIEPTPTSWLVYNFDGHILDLPTTSRIRRHSKPHWLPMVFAGNREVIDGAA